MQGSSVLRVSLAAACAIMFAGCGSGVRQAPPPVVVAVKGTVTYKAKPVPGALVTLRHPDSDKSAFGIADAKGQFSLATNDTDGIYPGTYRVTVTRPDGRLVIPRKYAAVETSNLELTVAAGEPQQFPIVLQD